ncbi:MAG: Cell division integral membrane protein, YggT and half-length relatives, partial [uncultured Sphingomonas sp.]
AASPVQHRRPPPPRARLDRHRPGGPELADRVQRDQHQFRGRAPLRAGHRPAARPALSADPQNPPGLRRARPLADRAANRHSDRPHADWRAGQRRRRRGGM